MAGASYGNQKLDLPGINYTANQKYVFGGNGALFAEYINHKYYRMQTELQYFMDGSKSKLTGQVARVNYYSINQFFKLRQELYDVTPYLLIGPRFEFLASEKTITGFNPFHISSYGAIGMEFLYKTPWIFLAEAGYTHDINKALYQKGLMSVINKAWVIRVGLKYEPKKKSKSCRNPKLAPVPSLPKE